MKRFLTFACTFLMGGLYSCCAYSHNVKIPPKNGFWIENLTEEVVKYTYYENGVEHGVFRLYNSYTQQLFLIGELYYGKMVGTWFFFDDDNHLRFRFDDFNNIDTEIPCQYLFSVKTAPYNCHCITYYSNGQKESEGRMCFFTDPMIDDSMEYGLWLYYDEGGNLIKSIVYE